MLNYIRADLYRIFTRVSFYIWCFVLVVVTILSIITMHDRVSAAMMTEVNFSLIYFAFSVFALLITEYTLREDSKYGMLKNDTTNGVSRTEVYHAKLISGLILISLLWILFSALCATSITLYFSLNEGLEFMQKVFGVQGIVLFFHVVLCFTLFQTLSVIIKNTSILILVCIGISFLLTKAGSIFTSVVPGAAEFFNRLDSFVVVENASFVNYLPVLLLLLLCCVAVTIFGNILFSRKEL